MAPSLSDYLHGLRRLWWVPLTALLLGFGIAYLMVGDASPRTVTTGHVLFTYRVEDPGEESAGSARGAEAEIAEKRLAGYVRLAAASAQIRDLLTGQGIDSPPATTTTATTPLNLGTSSRVSIAALGSGVVDVRLANGLLSASEGAALVEALSREIASIAIATDTLQESPSLLPDPVVTPPSLEQSARSPGVLLLAPTLLLLVAGAALVYLVVWRQGRIYTRRDLQDRLGARVLAEWTGQTPDAAALALALVKGRDQRTRALLASVGAGRPDRPGTLAGTIVEVGAGLGLSVSVTPASEALRPSGVVRAAPPDDRSGVAVAAGALDLVVTTDGLDVAAVHAAVFADVVGLIVEYGTTSYRDVTAAGHLLAEVTDAEIVVIGVAR